MRALKIALIVAVGVPVVVTAAVVLFAVIGFIMAVAASR